MFLNESIIYNENEILKNISPFIYENFNILKEYLESDEYNLVLESDDENKILKDFDRFKEEVDKELAEKVTDANHKIKKLKIFNLLELGISIITVALIFTNASIVLIAVSYMLSLLGSLTIIGIYIKYSDKIDKDIARLNSLKSTIRNVYRKTKDKKIQDKLEDLMDKIDKIIDILEKGEKEGNK